MLTVEQAAWETARAVAGCPANAGVKSADFPEPYAAIYGAVCTGDTTNVLATFDGALAQMPAHLANQIRRQVFAQDISQAPRTTGGDVDEDDELPMPPLPDEARIEGDIQSLLPQSWIAHYCTFADTAAPMSPHEFNLVLGLSLLSAAVSRRVRLSWGTRWLYTNLYSLIVAPSTLYHKSTAFSVAQAVLTQSGLDHLMLPQMQTPEALIVELSLQRPSSFSSWSQESRDLWMMQRRFAAQRLWCIDEASRLFDSFGREYTAALLPLVLSFYDCADREVTQTLGRGREVVKDAYLTIAGATTPEAIRPHLLRPTNWANGLWPRFALVMPSRQLPAWRFMPDAVPVSATLCDALRDLAVKHLAVPQTRMGEDGAVQLESPPPLVARIDAGARSAWETYTHAVGHTMLVNKQVDEAVFSSYGRLPFMAIKVAMLLATAEWSSAGAPTSGVVVTLAHWRAAQAITERWRHSLHRLLAYTQRTRDERVEDRILQHVKACPGVTSRALQRALHYRRDELDRVVQTLVRDGLLSEVRSTNVRGSTTAQYFIAEKSTCHSGKGLGDM